MNSHRDRALRLWLAALTLVVTVLVAGVVHRLSALAGADGAHHHRDASGIADDDDRDDASLGGDRIDASLQRLASLDPPIGSTSARPTPWGHRTCQLARATLVRRDPARELVSVPFRAPRDDADEPPSAGAARAGSRRNT